MSGLVKQVRELGFYRLDGSGTLSQAKQISKVFLFFFKFWCLICLTCLGTKQMSCGRIPVPHRLFFLLQLGLVLRFGSACFVIELISMNLNSRGRLSAVGNYDFQEHLTEFK